MFAMRRASFLVPVLGLFAGISFAGCGSEPTPPSQAYISSSSDFVAGGQQLCPTNPAEWIQIGSSSKSIADGELQTGATVTVYCRVAPLEGGKFDVEARASVKGDNGGTVQIMGTLEGGKAEKVGGTFQKGALGSFSQSDCTFDYSSNSNMGIAEGRVWGRIECSKAADTSGRRVGDPPETAACKFLAEVKFENCARSADGT